MSREFGRPEIRNPYWSALSLSVMISPKALEILRKNLVWPKLPNPWMGYLYR